jgi:hypothetical protein
MARLSGFIRVAVFAAVTGVMSAPDSPGGTLSPEEIMQKAVQRAESPLSHEARPDYRYTKRSVTEELDKHGTVKDRTEKVFEVAVISGLSHLRLVGFNGQKLSAAELKKQDDREAAERARLAHSKPGQKGDERENFLTSELVARFKFTLLGMESVNGRPAFKLSYEPRDTNAPARKIAERFLNQMAGTVWIDAREFEIARAEVHLLAEVTLWAGIIGTLRECSYTLERTRLRDGTWFNHSSRGIFEGRKLLDSMLIRTRSDSSDFRRATLATR